MRAVLFGALAKGPVEILSPLDSPDVEAMKRAMTDLFRGEDRQIDCGNSGIVLRFIGALAGLREGRTSFTGDESIQTRRPVAPLIEGLNQLGAKASLAKPLVVEGPWKGGRATIDGADSQPVSGLLIAAAFSPDPVELCIVRAGERPWVDLTLSWFDRLGIPYERVGYERYFVPGKATVPGFRFQVPADFSSAAFLAVAAVITGSTIVIENLDFSDVQGDKKLFEILQAMGVPPKGMEIDVDDLIDAVPILAVLGCFAKGTTRLVNAKMARKKESDRLHVMATELRKMGARIEEKEEELVIHESPLRGCRLFSHNDHRVALALIVAALGAKGESQLEGTGCIAKSYPTFVRDMQGIGARIE